MPEILNDPSYTFTTNYTYNAQNVLLTKVKTGTSEVNYGYDPAGNRLISLSHNTSSSSSDNVNYSFQYNGYGTQTGIKVGTQNHGLVFVDFIMQRYNNFCIFARIFTKNLQN